MAIPEPTQTNSYEPSQALSQSEERFKLLVETLPHGVQECDTDGVITFSNSAHAKMLGYEDGELIGKRIWELQDDKFEQDKLRKYLALLVNEQPNPTPYFSRNRTKDGKTIDVQVDWTYQRDDKGNVLRFASVITDITEQQQLEDRLSEERDRAQNYLDLAGEIVIAIDSQQKITLVNQEGCQLLECSESEIVGKNWFDNFIPSALRDTVRKAYSELMRGEIVRLEHYENEILTDKGKLRTVSWHNSLVTDEAGKITGTLSAGTDVTEQRRVEKLLHESEKQFRQIAETIREVFWTVSPDWRVVHYISPAYEEIWGRTSQSLYDDPHSWFHAVHVDDQEVIQSAIEQNTGKVVPDYKFPEYRVVRPDGSIRWISARGYPVYNEKNEVVQITGIARDITEHKQIENDFASMFNVIPDAVILTDQKRRVVKCNPASLKTFGYSEQELIGANAEIFYAHKNDFITHGKIYSPSNKNQEDNAQEVLCKRKDGSTLWMEVSGTPITDDKGEICGYIRLGHNITKRKQTDEALQRSHAELERRIEERTAELVHINRELREEIQIRQHAQTRESEFGRILDESLNEIYIFDAESLRFVQVNRGGRENLGYSMEELCILTPLDLKPALTAATFSELVSPLREGRKNKMSFETMHRRKDGSQYPIEAHIQLADFGNKPCFVAVILDISLRKQAEDELRLSSEIMENMAEGVSLVRASDGVIVYTNPRFEELYGYLHGELLGKRVSMLNAPGDQTPHEIAEPIISGLQEKGSWTGELQNLSKDGSTFWSQATVSAFEHSTFGEVWVAVHENISENREIQQALQASNKRSDEAQRIAKYGNWEWDIIDGSLYWSDETYRIFGFEKHDVDVTYDTFLQVVHPDDRDMVQNEVDKALSLGIPYSIDHRIVQADGRTLIVHEEADVIRDNRGQPIRMIGTAQDITERKQIEEALRESEKRYRAVVEDIPVLIARYLPDGELTFVNNAFSKYIGKSPEMLVGLNFLTMIPGADRETVLSNITALTADSPTLSHEHQVISKDGEIRWHRWNNRAIFDTEGKAITYQAVGEDITERMMAEEQLRENQEKLSQINRLSTMGELATGIAHELNQPLGAMLLYASEGQQILAESGSIDPEQLGELFERLTRLASHAGKIIKQFRRFVSKKSTTLEPIDIAIPIENLLFLLEVHFRQDSICVEKKMVQEQCLVAVDEIQIQQVLLNLIQNAMDAMRENGFAQRTLKITTTSTADKLIEISVCDNGHSVPIESEEKIFDAFYSSKPEGMGMGLTISRTIVESHGGRLWMTSNMDRGVTFHFTLPRAC